MWYFFTWVVEWKIKSTEFLFYFNVLGHVCRNTIAKLHEKLRTIYIYHGSYLPNILSIWATLTYAPLLDVCITCCSLDGLYSPVCWTLSFDIITSIPSFTKGYGLYLPTDRPVFILFWLFMVDQIFISHWQSLQNGPDANFLSFSLQFLVGLS